MPFLGNDSRDMRTYVHTKGLPVNVLSHIIHHNPKGNNLKAHQLVNG